MYVLLNMAPVFSTFIIIITKPFFVVVVFPLYTIRISLRNLRARDSYFRYLAMKTISYLVLHSATAAMFSISVAYHCLSIIYLFLIIK